MAYISSDQVKAMRNKLKTIFPQKDGWKMSITKENCTAVNCVIIKAPIELRANTERPYESVNHYSIDRIYSEKTAEVLTKIKEVLNTDNFDKSDSMTDYFHVGHYVNISIGNWQKPFKVCK